MAEERQEPIEIRYGSSGTGRHLALTAVVLGGMAARVNGWVMQPDEAGDLPLGEEDRKQADDRGHFTGRRHTAAVQRLWNHPAGRCSPM